MFNLLFFLLLKKYNLYYQNINDYNKYTSELLTTDRETIIKKIFEDCKVYDIDIINGIIQTYHSYKIYFNI